VIACIKERQYEENISTTQSKKKTYSRISSSYEDQIWPKHLISSPRQGSHSFSASHRHQEKPLNFMPPESSDQSFSKKERVCRRADFVKIQRKGLKYQTEHFLIFVLATKHSSRLGITVSKKVGGAVQRNRVKRLLRESYRRHKDLFPEGLDLVFVAKTEATQGGLIAFKQQVNAVSRWVQQVAKAPKRP
jgi:ribonuclease P protein component